MSAPGLAERVCPSGHGRGTASTLVGRSPVRLALALLLLTPWLALGRAQALPPGFGGVIEFATTTQAPSLWAAAPLATGQQAVAIGGRLFFANGQLPATPILQLNGDDIAFVLPLSNGVALGALRRGTVIELDLSPPAVRRRFPGVANAFDAARLPTGALLVSANPLWPASGARTGVWLVAPGQPPRELLPLTGPSGPLLLRDNGDLVVGELGPSQPPMSARLLLVPAARLQQAIASGTGLTMADVAAIGTGWNRLYDLAALDDGRLAATDAQGGRVQTTAPGGLSPSAVLADVGSGRIATHLHFEPGSLAPFRGYGRRANAGSLTVLHSDFTTSAELLRVHPQRPTSLSALGPILTPGFAPLAVAGGPPGGLCLWLASTSPPGPEQILLWQQGAPLWLGIDPASSVPLFLGPLDALGGGSQTLLHPGGISGQIFLQAVALAAAGDELGSAAVLPLTLLP